MADYAGAETAIRNKLEAEWLTTRIAFVNEIPADPWPPVDGDMVLQPWVNLEVECYSAPIVGQGRPGNHVYRYDGIISVHVFIPAGGGTALGTQYATQIGEIFRRKKFYDDVSQGCCVRTEDPFVAGGDSGSDDGNWFGTTMTCAFTYWHRG